jgi:hypothetical protein
MATITLSYTAKKKDPAPFVDQLTENASLDTSCISQDTLDYSITGTKWVEIISTDASAYTIGISAGPISGTGTFQVVVEKFKSFQSNQNTFTDSVTVNIRTSNGGSIEDRYRLSRDHTNNNC